MVISKEATPMKQNLILLVLTASLLFCVLDAKAQDPNNSAQTADSLRLQLLDIQAKETELQARSQQLDEDLKPENIENYFAGVGSTRPEELRAQRRRQLTIEKDGVRAQLALLATSRVRLEAAIQTADTRAYQQSAQGFAPAEVNGIGGPQSFISLRLLVAAVFLCVLALAGMFLVLRNQTRRSEL